MKERDYSLDTLKFLLVCFVVLGHVVGLNKTDTLNLVAKNFIYSFHIPLFVFISGYFSKGIVNLWSLTKLVEIFIVSEFLYIFPSLLDGSFSVAYFIKPYWHLWYLFSLITWRLLYVLIFSKIKYRWGGVISILICLVSGLIPLGHTLSLSRTCVFLPFFIMGVYTSNDTLNRVKTIDKKLATIIVLIVLFFLISNHTDLSGIYSGVASYPFFSENLVQSILIRIGWLIVSFVLCFCVLSLLSRTTFLHHLGEKSIIFYVYHGFFVLLLKYIIETYSIPSTLPWMLLYAFVILILLYLFSKLKFSSWLLSPLSINKHFK